MVLDMRCAVYPVFRRPVFLRFSHLHYQIAAEQYPPILYRDPSRSALKQLAWLICISHNWFASPITGPEHRAVYSDN